MYDCFYTIILGMCYTLFKYVQYMFRGHDVECKIQKLIRVRAVVRKRVQR